MNQFLFGFLVNNPQTSMSVYKHPYTGAFQFTFTDVEVFENIALNWLYDKFCICYKNEIFEFRITSALRHFLHHTLCFGKVVFQKLMYDVTQIKIMKSECGIIKIIRDYFAIDNYNYILIYRPTDAELIIKKNEIEEKKAPNKTCCVCLEQKYINDTSIFMCSHTELCWACYIKMGNNQCPLCRSSAPLSRSPS